MYKLESVVADTASWPARHFFYQARRPFSGGQENRLAVDRIAAQLGLNAGLAAPYRGALGLSVAGSAKRDQVSRAF